MHVLPLSSVMSSCSHVSFNNFRHRAGWVKLEGASNALITARLAPDNTGARCIATVLARSDCWAFVKGGFVLDWPTQTAVIFFQVSVASDERCQRVAAAVHDGPVGDAPAGHHPEGNVSR